MNLHEPTNVEIYISRENMDSSKNGNKIGANYKVEQYGVNELLNELNPDMVDLVITEKEQTNLVSENKLIYVGFLNPGTNNGKQLLMQCYHIYRDLKGIAKYYFKEIGSPRTFNRKEVLFKE